MEAATSSAIQGLLRSSKRKRSSEGSPTAPAAKAARVGETKSSQALPAPASTASAEARPDDDLLTKLFACTDKVLMMLATRRREQPTFDDKVKPSIERFAGRDLTEDRLEQMLGLSDGMLDPVWVGCGASAVLELRQLSNDGLETTPTVAEAAERLEKFRAALGQATASGQIPRKAFPPKPASSPSPSAIREESVPSVQMIVRRTNAEAVAAAASNVAGGSGGANLSRMEALRARVLARQQASKKTTPWLEAVDESYRQSRLCEDALGLHEVMQQLFARGQGKDSAAAEEELISAVSTSDTSQRQARRHMDKDKATDALYFLIKHSSGWFEVEEPKFSTTRGKLFKKLLDGRSIHAKQSLQAELREQQRRRDELLAAGPGAAAPLAPSKIDADAAAGAPCPGTPPAPCRLRKHSSAPKDIQSKTGSRVKAEQSQKSLVAEVTKLQFVDTVQPASSRPAKHRQLAVDKVKSEPGGSAKRQRLSGKRAKA